MGECRFQNHIHGFQMLFQMLIAWGMYRNSAPGLYRAPPGFLESSDLDHYGEFSASGSGGWRSHHEVAKVCGHTRVPLPQSSELTTATIFSLKPISRVVFILAHPIGRCNGSLPSKIVLSV